MRIYSAASQKSIVLSYTGTFRNSRQSETHAARLPAHLLRAVRKYGVRENDRKRMLGHSFGGDVTNAVYGHRTLEELRTEIEKIKVPFVTNCD